MGDMADLFSGEWDDDDADDPVAYYAALEPQVLVAECAKSRSPLVMGIRQHYARYGRLSVKQRWRLAYWCADRDCGEDA